MPLLFAAILPLPVSVFQLQPAVEVSDSRQIEAVLSYATVCMFSAVLLSEAFTCRFRFDVPND
jgi:hypothetical protein